MRKNVLIALLMCFMVTSQLFAVQTVTAFTPSSAKAGVEITITGTNFTATTTVKFGGVSASSVTYVNATTIKATTSANGNSGNITVEDNSVVSVGFGNFAFLATTLSTLVSGDVVINKVYNSITPNGADDAVELLVVKDHADLRALYIRDARPANAGSALSFFFREILFWSDVRSGTLIVLRKSATTSDITTSLVPADFTLDIGLLDVNYMIAGNYADPATGPYFDIDANDFISVQGAPYSTYFTNAIANLGGGVGSLSTFNAASPQTAYRLSNSTLVTGGNFLYVTNSNSTITDFQSAQGTATYSQNAANDAKTISNVTMNNDATPAALVLGTPNNATNATYITGLRATVLPVNLISFTAKKGTNGIELNWATASEQNNNRFELQRSADGNSFVTIKTVTGANNANSRNNYSFLDKNPIAGVNYYKLVQIDNDGTVKELGVQAVSSDLKGLAFNVSSYGDINQINYTVYATTSGRANISVFDLSGKEVANTTIDLSAGNNNLKINSNNLKSGVYVAVLKADNNTLTSKFVK